MSSSASVDVIICSCIMLEELFVRVSKVTSTTASGSSDPWLTTTGTYSLAFVTYLFRVHFTSIHITLFSLSYLPDFCLISFLQYLCISVVVNTRARVAYFLQPYWMQLIFSFYDNAEFFWNFVLLNLIYNIVVPETWEKLLWIYFFYTWDV